MTLRLLLFAIIAAAVIWLLAPFQAAGNATPFVFQTDMYGSEHVPPVNTVAWGFVRFFFNEDRTEADYTVDVKGLSGSLVLGADMHRGAPGTNGPIVRHLADGGFLTTSGRLKLAPDELKEFVSGAYYVTLSSTNNPKGEMRGQVIVPPGFLPEPEPPAPQQQPQPNQPLAVPPSESPPPPTGSGIRPPNTGQAGLASPTGPATAAGAPVALLFLVQAAFGSRAASVRLRPYVDASPARRRT
jgi:hypothetical protein